MKNNEKVIYEIPHIGGIHRKKATYQNSVIFLVNTTWASLTYVLD